MDVEHPIEPADPQHLADRRVGPERPSRPPTSSSWRCSPASVPSTSLDIDRTPEKSSTSRVWPASTSRRSCPASSAMSSWVKRTSASRTSTMVFPSTVRTRMVGARRAPPGRPPPVDGPDDPAQDLAVDMIFSVACPFAFDATGMCENGG